jgi:hypothetical protein
LLTVFSIQPTHIYNLTVFLLQLFLLKVTCLFLCCFFGNHLVLSDLYRSFVFFVVLEIKPWVLYMLAKCSATEIHPQYLVDEVLLL